MKNFAVISKTFQDKKHSFEAKDLESAKNIFLDWMDYHSYSGMKQFYFEEVNA